MPDRILVTGATGELGRELVRILLASRHDVRAATRFPTAARQLFGPAAEVVELDYDSTETYDAAVQWVDRIFLMPPPLDSHAFDTLVPFLDWAVASGVGKVVLLSAMGAAAIPELALRKLELHLDSLGIAATHLRPNLYHQNFSSGFIHNAIQSRGEFELCAGNASVSFVDVRDVAAVAAMALTSNDLDGATVTLTGPAALDLSRIAALLSQAMSRTITYRPVSAARMREVLRAERWPDAQIDVAIGLFESVGRGDREHVHPDLPRLLGRTPIPFEQFAQEIGRSA
jgi:uncharacterized protein YbjT (DUF2867 family)